jgi:hypothetical protein
MLDDIYNITNGNVKYNKQYQQGNAAFYERNPRMAHQQEPVARILGGPKKKKKKKKHKKRDRAKAGKAHVTWSFCLKHHWE